MDDECLRTVCFLRSRSAPVLLLTLALACCAGPKEKTRPEGPDAERLIRGFGVVEITLGVSQRDRLLFSITAPSGARYVSCGLFIAVPTIDQQNKKIERCPGSLWLQKTVRVADGALSTSDRTFEFGLDSFSPLAGADAGSLSEDCWGSLCNFSEYSACPVVSRLQVGCWVASHDGVVAATELHDVSAKDLPGNKLPVESCASSDAGAAAAPDGQWCTIRVGTCEGGRCVASTIWPNPAHEGDAATEVLPTCGEQTDTERCVAAAIGTCVAGQCRSRHGKLADVPSPLLVAECIPSSNYLNCEGAPDETIGTCLDSRCVARCSRKEDCESIALALGVDAGAVDCFAVTAEDGGARLSDAGIATGQLGLCPPMEVR